jgi:putative SOS response-associated peptidase YedK
MCGRFAFYSPHEAVVRLFGVGPDTPEVEPRWNIAPTQFVPAVRADEAGRRSLSMLYWGLVPGWAKEKAIGARMINARAETLAEKPSFRSAFKRRRCLVLADGYYEWQRSGAVKQPYYIRLASGEPFAMAGLWERWRDPESGSPLESCTIVTTTPAAAIAHLHDRMPVILAPESYGIWLAPDREQSVEIDRLLGPSGLDLAAGPVGRQVNNARNDGPDLVEPLAE